MFDLDPNDPMYADAEALVKREERDSAIRQTKLLIVALYKMLGFLQKQHGCIVEVGKSDKGIHIRIDGKQLI